VLDCVSQWLKSSPDRFLLRFPTLWGAFLMLQCLKLCLLALATAASGSLPATCVWNGSSREPQCETSAYRWAYPECALFQYADLTPIPCQGLVHGDFCKYDGAYGNSTPPLPASWHVHVFFPNPRCTNCSLDFTSERRDFTYEGAMRMRRDLAEQLNLLNRLIKGSNPLDPIDLDRALNDPDYNQCGSSYNIVAGAPANYHTEPCIFEVDAVKKGGPFTDPSTGSLQPPELHQMPHRPHRLPCQRVSIAATLCHKHVGYQH
jgi:hypothetical protein